MNRIPRLLPLLLALAAAAALLCAPCAMAQETPLVPPLSCVQMAPQADAAPVPLYCGPTQGFYRHQAQTLDPSQPFVLFGHADCWAMAAQGTPDAFGPVGWVEAAALALPQDAPVLAFGDALQAMIEEDAPVTDHPLAADPFGAWGAALPRGEQVTLLAAFGDWLYAQAEIDGAPARVFLPAECVL